MYNTQTCSVLTHSYQIHTLVSVVVTGSSSKLIRATATLIKGPHLCSNTQKEAEIETTPSCKLKSLHHNFPLDNK